MTMRAPLLALALVTLVLLQSGCFESRYLAGQALGQWHLFRVRERIADILDDPHADPVLQARLRLAMEARTFGIEVLGLRGGDNFTRYLATHGKPIAWNITVAPKDTLHPVVWRFPIVGAVPYLGFFAEKDARTFAASAKARGLDTYVRPVAGYSTIGIASDPVYESMLDEGDARIVEVVLHEMLHGTLYLPGRSAWNESFATFVGVHGAALFFASRHGDDAGKKVLEEAEQRERDEARFGAFLAPVHEALEKLYAEPISRDEKLRRREDVFAETHRRFEAEYPGRHGIFSDARLNNAVVASFGVYHHSAPEHDRIWKRMRGNLRRMVDLYRYAVENTDDPTGWLSQF